jgi:hypothetical protein
LLRVRHGALHSLESTGTMRPPRAAVVSGGESVDSSRR